MNEKVRKILMREAYMGVVALAIFIVVFVLRTALPGVKESIVETLAKDTDLKKLLSLFGQIVKEMI